MDRKIVEFVEQTAEPRPGDGAAIRQHVAAASFDHTSRPAAEWAKIGTPLLGRPHPTTGQPIQSDTLLSSLEAHVAKRIHEERWAANTTPTEYLSDLRLAAANAVRVKVGLRDEGPLASTTTPDSLLLTASTKYRRGAGRHLFVVYNARKRAIVSGYSEPEPFIANLHRAWKKLRIIPL
ncbi:MAG: hypothetical protein ACOZQL_13045 [Myxococcota bacterium]